MTLPPDVLSVLGAGNYVVEELSGFRVRFRAGSALWIFTDDDPDDPGGALVGPRRQVELLHEPGVVGGPVDLDGPGVGNVGEQRPEVLLADDSLAWKLGPGIDWKKVPSEIGVDAHITLRALAEARAATNRGRS